VGGWGLVYRTGRARAVASTAPTRSGTGTNCQRKCCQRSHLVSTFMVASLVCERAHCGQRGPRRSLVAMAPLCECEGLGLRSLCSRLVATVGPQQQRCSLVATALLSECECHGLLSPCSTLDVLACNVGKDRVQRGSEEFTCRLVRPIAASKKFGDTTSWRGCLPARELAADSAASDAALCRRRSSTRAWASDDAARAPPQAVG